ncbi:MAG: hypothetical protein RR141_06915, partial [Rikenellaceae bacterium]
MKKYLILPLFIICFFTACNKADETIQYEPKPDIEEPVKDIMLSAKWSTDIEGDEYQFDILDGNGAYTASVAEQDAAKVVI